MTYNIHKKAEKSEKDFKERAIKGNERQHWVGQPLSGRVFKASHEGVWKRTFSETFLKKGGVPPEEREKPTVQE